VVYTLLALITTATNLFAGASSQPHGKWFTTPAGDQLMLRDFRSAPFPHPSRADGWTNKSGTHFDADRYRDSTIGIVIPRTFKQSDTLDIIVHFHGHQNHVENVLDHYELIDQLPGSGKTSTILLVPQGPMDVADSSFGKLSEDAGSLDAMIDEVVAYLRSEQKISESATVCRIAISAHSGGYNAAGFVVARGAEKYLDHITDVLLFDASYGRLESFADWIKLGGDRRLVSLFTAHLADENFELMTLLKKRGVSDFDIAMESDLTPQLLPQRKAIFIHTPDLPHDEVMQKKRYFEIFVKTSSLR
jgi:hypothetical protein